MKITHKKSELNKRKEQNQALQADDVRAWVEQEIKKPNGFESALLELAEAVQLLRDK